MRRRPEGLPILHSPLPADESHERLTVPLPAGEVDVAAVIGRPDPAWAAVAIAHGAGAGSEHPFFIGLAAALRAAGVATVRFNFPYREAGRRMPGPPAHAIRTWAGIAELIGSRLPELTFFAAGKSYGGRMASMAAAEGAIVPAGLVYLGYPLHPPGDVSKLRTAHLASIAVPQLFIQGTKDPFARPHEQLEDAAASCQNAKIEWIEGGGHSFDVAGARVPADEVGAALAPMVAGFVESLRPDQRPAANPRGAQGYAAAHIVPRS